MKIIFFILLIFILSACDWKDKALKDAPKPVKDIVEKVWEKGTEIVREGKDLPAPVKTYLDSTIDIIHKNQE